MHTHIVAEIMLRKWEFHDVYFVTRRERLKIRMSESILHPNCKNGGEK
jgi:hypothetical protein